MKKRTVITIVIAALLCLVFLALNPMSANAQDTRSGESGGMENPVYVYFVDESGTTQTWRTVEVNSFIGVEDFPSAVPENANDREWYWADANGEEFTAATPVTENITVQQAWKQDITFEGLNTITVTSFSTDVTFPELPDSDKEGGWEANGNIYEVGSNLIQENGDIPANHFTPIYKVKLTFDQSQGKIFTNNSEYEPTYGETQDKNKHKLAIIKVYPGTEINLNLFRTEGRSNRTFLGWTDVHKDSHNQRYLSSITPTEDTAVYAMWGSTVTFDTSAFSGVTAPQKKIGYVGSGDNNWIASAPASVYDPESDEMIDVVTSFTVPAPETNLQNIVFKGWSKSKTSTKIDYKENQKVNFPKDDITLYPVYENFIKVTFNSNGGGTAPDGRLYGPGSEVTDTPGTWNGHTFLGWSEDKNAETAGTYTIPADKTGNLTLYAVWRENDPNTKFGLLLDSANLPSNPTNTVDAKYFTSGKIDKNSPEEVWKTVNVLIKDNVKIKGTIKATASTDVNLYDGPDTGSNTVANDVTAALKRIPDNGEISRIFDSYDPDTQFVLWYYLQTKTTKIGGEEYHHVDGVILDRKLDITVNAGNAEKTYGDSTPELTVTASAKDVSNNVISVTSEKGNDNKYYIKSSNERVLATCELTVGEQSEDGITYPITPSCTASSPKFSVDTNDGNLTVTPIINLTAEDQSKVYGENLDNFDAAIQLNGDEPNACVNNECTVVIGETSVTCSLGHEGDNNVGEHQITATCTSTLSDDQYIINDDGLGKLTITPLITVAAENQTWVYGDPENLVATFELNGNEVPATCAESACTVTIDENDVTFNLSHGDNNAGEHQITVARPDSLSSDYTINDEGLGKLTITKKPVTITADLNQGKVYGTAGDPLTATVTMDGNNLASICDNGQCEASTGINQDKITYTIRRSSGSDAGEYAITVTPGSAPNYNIDINNGTYTITRATATVTANDASKVYGEDDPTLTATVTGLVNGDTVNVISYNTPKRSNDNENVGIYTITVNGDEEQGNYIVKYEPGELTITRATATVTADANSKVYGEDDPTLTATVTGLVNGDTENVITYNKPVRKEGVNVGTYTITVDGDVEQGNYNVEYKEGSFTITEKPIIITADSDEKVYDGEPLTRNAIVAIDLPYGDKVGSVDVDGHRTVVGSSDNIASNVVIVNQKGENATTNYTIQEWVNGTLKVTQKPLTITAASKTATYTGSAISTNEYINGELADGDWIESVAITGTQTEVGSSSNIASEAVIRNANGDDVTNCYEIDYVNGILEVTMAQNVIITADSDKKVYDGTALTASGYTYSGLAEGHRLESVNIAGSQMTVGTSANVPSNAVILDQNGVDVSANYNINYREGTLEVTKKSVSVIADDDVKIYDGSSLHKDSYHHTALAAGDSIESVNVTGGRTQVGTTANVAKDAVIVNAAGEDVTANYEISYANGNLYVQARPVTVTPVNLTKEYGQLDPEFTAKVDGILPGDKVNYTMSRIEGEEPGEYEITATGLAFDGNYAVKYETGTLTINFNPTAQTFEKVWEDDNNRDGLRPTSLRVTLRGTDGKIHGSQNLTDANKWTATIIDLPLYSGGNKIEYRWEEEPVSGYTVEGQVNGNVTTTVSTHEITRTTSSVNVVWNDKDNVGSTRPDSLVVVLRGNDRTVLRTTLNADIEWSAITNNLPMFEDGNPINYVWYEQSLGGGYYAVSSTTSNGNTTLTNSNLFKLTIHYRYNDGSEAAPDYTDMLYVGETFIVESPEVAGYIANPVSAVGIMPAAESEIIVVYAEEGQAVVKQIVEETTEEETVIIQKEVPQPREQLFADDEHTVVLLVPTKEINIEEYRTALSAAAGSTLLKGAGQMAFE